MGEGAALAEEAGDVGGFAGRAGICGSFIETPFGRFRDRTNVSGRKRYVLLILNKLGGEVSRKTGHVCPVCYFSPGADAAPLIPGYDWSSRNSGADRGVNAVSGLDGGGYGARRIFYVCVTGAWGVSCRGKSGAD